MSIEAREGVTTGISAADRAHTIQVAIDPATGPRDLVRPGHVFPLRARPGGVLQRTGQTEAAVDLARLAGLSPAGVICEVMNDDGTMARVPDLIPYCRKHGLGDDHDRGPDRVPAPHREARRARHVRAAPDRVRRVHRGRLPGDADREEPRRARPRARSRAPDDVLVRVHSECLTGDVFHSLRCDCGEQLERALAADRRRGARRAPLHGAGGPRHRSAQQAAGLRAAGERARHRRGEPRARLPGRRARVRHRLPDPRRPRPERRSGCSRTTRARSAASRRSG